MKPFLWITAFSLLLFTAAQVAYLITRGPKRSAESLPPASPAAHYDLEFEGDARYPTWRRLAWGAAFVWISAFLFTGVLPAVDPANTESTILGDEVRQYPAGSIELDGRNLYISEGCVQCHTQNVRPVGTDVGLGPVTVAGDLVHENPTLVGSTRAGPDLMHVASSPEFNAATLANHLKDPRQAREWSTMPSYSYLSASDIEAIVSYIETLR
jgi:cbb3-type cytochrome c oxidase subunit II